MGLHDFQFGENREEKIDKFLDNLAWHFHTKQAIDYTARATEKLVVKLNELNETVREASVSSGNLTKALNHLTFWGIIIAGVGVLVAFGNFIFEVFKYFYGGN